MKEHKHTKDELRYLQSLPLDMKIRLTQQRIHEWVREFGEDGVYVSFSGGKDSTVLLNIVRGLYPDVPAVFVDTGLEYPEIRDFVKRVDNVIWLRPEMSFNQVLKNYGYPLFSKETAANIELGRRAVTNGNARLVDRYFHGVRYRRNGERYIYDTMNAKALDLAINTTIPVSNKCCGIMKKNPVKKYEKETDRKAFVATLTDESKLREEIWFQSGCNAFEAKRPMSKPMSFWTEQDVLSYLLHTHTHNTRKKSMATLYTTATTPNSYVLTMR